MYNDDKVSYDFVDLIRAYNFADASLGFVGTECFVIALLTGLIKQSLGWGIAAFVIMGILYVVPVIGGVISIILSLIEMLIVSEILGKISPEVVAWGLSLLALFIFIELHRHYGVIKNDGIFGYSFILVEIVLVSHFLWYETKSIPAACVLFIALVVILFVPKLRGVVFIGLTLTTGVVSYAVSCEYLAIQYSIITTLTMLVYAGYNHYAAYKLLDYKGMKAEKRERKQREETFFQYELLKEKIYNKYPDLEKQYYYFTVSVCKTAMEHAAFEYDWEQYLNYLDTSEYCSFNHFFEENKLYRHSSYNKEFANEWKQEQERKAENDKKGQEVEFDGELRYFAGIKDEASLKKRYHELLKMYHPDNQNGDTTIAQAIQKEYEYVRKLLEEGLHI